MKEEEQERLEKKKEIDEELNIDEMFKDLAMISGMMDHEEEEEDEMEIEKEEEKEEEMKSLKQQYRNKPAQSPVNSLKRQGDDIEELLGAKEVELKSEVMICGLE